MTILICKVVLLAFKNVSDFGERFTDMCAPYDSSLNTKMMAIAKENNIVLHKEFMPQW
jgi:purine-nucleoside phosphorylase